MLDRRFHWMRFAILVSAGCVAPAPPPETGFLSMSIHDAPPEPAVSSIVVRLASVSVRSVDGAWIDLSAVSDPVDLLSLTDGRAFSALAGAPVPVGEYDELRLRFLDEPIAVVDGRSIVVEAPSGTTSGYKIKGHFRIVPGLCTSLSVDFDARRALRARPHDRYTLEPTIVIESTQTGSCGAPEGCTPDTDCNACLLDVPAAFARLRDHGDYLGFHMNGSPNVDEHGRHWQGIQRIGTSGPAYFAVSRSVDLSKEAERNVAFVIVRMDSRNRDGLRLRSNRLDPVQFGEVTPPPLEDGIVQTIEYDRTRDPGFNHAGGMQAIGRFLAVPFEKKGLLSRVVIYDLADPEMPRRVNEIDHLGIGIPGGASDEAGTASIAKMADGRYLLIIGRADADNLDFYVSSAGDLATARFDYIDSWNEGELLPVGTEFAKYQMLNLVTQCDGALYLIGTNNNGWILRGEDWVDLFLVELEPGTVRNMQITKVAKKQMYCPNDQCDFAGAGGVYIDPHQQLYLYASEKDNDGPAETVRLEEFRPVPHGGCATIGDAWVELYDDKGFSDRSLMIDWVDRELADYTNYDRAERFEDKGSAVRWCIPAGWRYRLWEHKEPCGGAFFDLIGTGAFEEIPDLEVVGFQDKASCSEWLPF